MCFGGCGTGEKYGRFLMTPLKQKADPQNFVIILPPVNFMLFHNEFHGTTNCSRGRHYRTGGPYRRYR